jgi:fibronectin type 3 domain-containing protein
VDTGGEESLTYQVLRGTSAVPMDIIVDVQDAFEHLDTTVVRGTTYYYQVIAVSSVGEGAPGTVVQVTAAEAPGQVTDLQAVVGNAKVDLTWSAPDDGGSAIIEYVILRGIFRDSLTELTRVTSLNPADTDVENGKTYYYQVYAVNAVGSGARSDVISAKPLGPPGAPGVLTGKVKDGSIRLTWASPTAGNTAEVTGYRVFRGESEYELELLAELGPVNSYVDEDVKENRPYFYKVVATSDSGDSEMSRLARGKVVSEEEPGFGAVLAVLALSTLIVLGRWRRRW